MTWHDMTNEKSNTQFNNNNNNNKKVTHLNESMNEMYYMNSDYAVVIIVNR